MERVMMMKHITILIAFLMTFGSGANADEQFNLDEWVFLSCQERDILSDKLGDWTKNRDLLVRQDHTLMSSLAGYSDCELGNQDMTLLCKNNEYDSEWHINRFTGEAFLQIDGTDDVRFYICRAIEEPMF
jgi:hypothetical protein